jgi:DNA-binding NarL/FixJ family response regulator
MTQIEPRIRILIADDWAMFRYGLKALLSEQKEFQVVGEASNGDDVLKLVARLQPHLLLLELSMRGIAWKDVLRSLAELHSDVRTIILTVALKNDEIPVALKLGARGFVVKDSDANTLVKSIKAVMRGQYWIHSNSVSSSDEILKYVKDSPKTKKSNRFNLSHREIEIVKAVTSGRTNKDIAKHLDISEHTVKHHITAIFDKLGVYNRLELALFVHHHEGMIDE